MRPRRFLCAALVTVLAAGVVTAVAVGSRGHRQVGPPASQTRLNCPAPALGGTLPTLVYLPRDYQPEGRPLPVIYFMHGLPADPTTYTQYSFVANALDGASQRAIVVAFQGARSANDDQEYLDWSPTDDWPKAISQQLVTCIDSHFDAMRSRRGRALVGLSAGGYGAMNIGLRNLRTYSVVEAWSGYFAATNPSGLSELNFGTPIESAAARVLRGPQLKAALGHDPSTLIGFYVGRSDARFYDANALFSRTLTAERIPHVFRTYPGGHTPSLWEEHAKGWMRMAVAYLARRRVVAP